MSTGLKQFHLFWSGHLIGNEIG